MKKLFAIFMVVIILFNAGGYDLFFQYLIYRSDTNIVQRINSNRYHNSDLVEVKIPVNLPTQQDWDAFQAVSGHVQFHNTRYDYAEIKITRDTLYLLVIPNTERGNLAKANMAYGKQVNDIPANSKRTNTLAKKSLSESEYLTFDYIPAPLVEAKIGYPNLAVSGITKLSLDVGGQPPEHSVFLS